MAKFIIAILTACACTVSATVNYALTDCARDRSTELLNIPTSHTDPYPISVPGNLAVTGTLRLNRDLPRSAVTLKVSIERYVGFFWLTVPCINNVGSCTYHDACSLLDQVPINGACPPQFANNNVPCTCPFTAGNYTMANTVFEIPEVSGIYSWLAAGDYRVKLQLLNPSGQELACQQMEATLVNAGHSFCRGFLCSIFG